MQQAVNDAVYDLARCWSTGEPVHASATTSRDARRPARGPEVSGRDESSAKPSPGTGKDNGQRGRRMEERSATRRGRRSCSPSDG